ncbi:MAG: hypothetical protein K2M44_05070 [Clostridia bacterium]|nr:hypothetical protein [Clostridia bacterium]
MSDNQVKASQINTDSQESDKKIGYDRNDYVVCPVCGQPNMRPVAICKYCSNYMM